SCSSVTFERKCGHKEENLNCGVAFDKAATQTECKKIEIIPHPECGHDCKISCHQLTSIAGNLPRVRPIDHVIEGTTTYGSVPGFPNIHCTAKVTFTRKC